MDLPVDYGVVCVCPSSSATLLRNRIGNVYRTRLKVHTICSLTEPPTRELAGPWTGTETFGTPVLLL
jgi:hypothetical protein